MKILAVSGSLRPGSTNAMLVQAIADLAGPARAVTVYDGTDDLPHFSPDLDGDAPDDAPVPVRRLRGLLADADSPALQPGGTDCIIAWGCRNAGRMSGLRIDDDRHVLRAEFGEMKGGG